MTVLRLDAEENSAPGHVLTLTSRAPITDAGAYRAACYQFWRKFRKRWGRVEYCGFIEWTTGEGPRAGGRRRMHSHWLIKGLELEELEEAEQWASQEWKRLTGAWIVQLAELRTVGGIVGYLALHHEKLSQAPPAGWRGMRFRPSRGYFGSSLPVLRSRARLWLAARRAELEGVTEGEGLTIASTPVPRVVFRTPQAELELRRELSKLGPGESFASPRNRRWLDAQLERAHAAWASEAELERYERLYVEMRTTLALRNRARRRYGVSRPESRIATARSPGEAMTGDSRPPRASPGQVSVYGT